MQLDALPRPDWIRRRLGGATGAGVRVAVVDSGWDDALPVPGLAVDAGVALDRAGRPLPGPPRDRTGHGTACLWTAFQVAPGAVFAPVRVFDDGLETSVEALVAALRWAAAAGCDVINLSLGVRGGAGALPLYRACAEAAAAGCVIVAAAGAGRDLPARFDTVLGVGEGEGEGPFSFACPPGGAVECRATPGVFGLVPAPGGRMVPARGPSYAAPVVSGVVALLRERHPAAPLPRIRALLARVAPPPGPPAA